MNDSSHFRPNLTNGSFPKFNATIIYIIIDVPVNNTECVSVAATN